jgi:AbrB family looped-hinge helix DNA binding protein
MKKMKFWGTACVGAKGQVVIPAKARKQFKIQEGDQLLVLSLPGKSGVTMAKADDLEKLLASAQSHITHTLQSLKKSKKG